MANDHLADLLNPALVLDPGVAPDSDWARALVAGDHVAARAAYVKLIRSDEPRVDVASNMATLQRTWHGRDVGFAGGHNLEPDEVIQFRYTGAYGTTHQFEGDIDWHLDPTADWGENQSMEWQVQLNRHYQWVPLAKAYVATGDAKYARHFEFELRSWIRQCPRPNGSGLVFPSAWRSLDVGLRTGMSWPMAFETFRHSDEVSDEAIWLMIASWREQAMHLLYYPRARNWKAVESSGLAITGLMFPELRLSRAFNTTGIDRTLAELERQVYPDGIQDELAPSYGVLSMMAFYSALAGAAFAQQRFGGWIPDDLVPPATWERITGMIMALARHANPAGIAPPLHDSPPVDVSLPYEDWTNPATGEPLPTPPPWTQDRTDYLPFGGYSILQRESRWALFDVGPYGSGHQHQDVLQVMTWAFGQDMLIDPGKPLYNKSERTRTMRGSTGHNLVLMDHLRHIEVDRQARALEPMPITRHGEGPVWLAGAKRRFEPYEDQALGQPGFAHERMLLDVAGVGWLVIDRVWPEDEKPHMWEWLWHTAADRMAITGERSAEATFDAGPAMAFDVRAGRPLTLATVAGEHEPRCRAWRDACPRSEKSTGEPGESEPQPTPTLQAISDGKAGATWCVTLVTPAKAKADLAAAVRIKEAKAADDLARLEVELTNGTTLCLVGGDCWQSLKFTSDAGEMALTL